MKTTVFSFTTLFLACGFSGLAQIFPPVQSPVGVAGTVVHTGLAVAPNEDYYAVVYDEPGGTNYTINWLDDVGNLEDAASNPGENPDVAYYANADLVFVGYSNGNNVFIDDYYLATLSPLDYNLGSVTYVSSGKNPNIDCNSSGRGVLTWEDGGNIYACSFYPGLNLGPVTFIAPGGKNPDIVLLDNNDEIVVTYTTPSGGIHIETYDYMALTSGVSSMNNQWTYGGSSSSYFGNPRIAADRNANFGSLNNFTVVSEYILSSAERIIGFFYTGGIMNPNGINSATQSCKNRLPVVTYEREEVHIAWASNSSSACATVPGGIGDNVLLKEHKFDGTEIAPGVYHEVNSWMNGFIEGSPSISAEYDGNYIITNSNYHEAIVYNDYGDLLWKARNSFTPVLFKQASVEEHTTENLFKLLENPVKDVIYLTADQTEESTFVLYDNLGKMIRINALSGTANTYQINIKQLPKGIYFLECTSGHVTETIKIVH